MSGGKISPELFHIEYYGGEKKDMKAGEVSAVIALAASRRSDD